MLNGLERKLSCTTSKVCTPCYPKPITSAIVMFLVVTIMTTVLSND